MKAKTCVFLALGFALDLVGISRAGANEGLVELRVENCDAVRVDAVRAKLAIELPGATRTRAVSWASAVVVIHCAPLAVKLSVDDPLTGKALIRTIPLSDMDADVRARTIAIAIAELVAASWSELETNPSPQVLPMGVRPPANASSDALRVLRDRPGALLGSRLRLTAVASTQVFFSNTKALWGGGLRLAADSWRVFGWAVDLLEHHGDVDTGLGHVAIDTITVGAAAVAHRSWSRFGVRGGIGFRLGSTILRGSPATDGAARGAEVVWAGGGPFGTFGIRVSPVRGLIVEMVTEGGYWVFPTGGLVNGNREITVEGPWVGVQLGIGIAL